MRGRWRLGLARFRSSPSSCPARCGARSKTPKSERSVLLRDVSAVRRARFLTSAASGNLDIWRAPQRDLPRAVTPPAASSGLAGVALAPDYRCGVVSCRWHWRCERQRIRAPDRPVGSRGDASRSHARAGRVTNAAELRRRLFVGQRHCLRPARDVVAASSVSLFSGSSIRNGAVFGARDRRRRSAGA